MVTNQPPALPSSFSLLAGAASRWALHLGATLTILAPLLALIVFWPLPYWGFGIDLVSAEVFDIEPGSMADRAGIRDGDRILAVYDYTWEEIDQQLFIDPLDWGSVTEVPIRVERGAAVLDLTMPALPPSPLFQLEKVVVFALALSFWVTGYAFGLVRRHESHGTPVVAWFWMTLGALIGCYTFALYESYPITIAIQWMLLTIIVPIALYIHVWFPARPVAAAHARSAQRWTRRALVALQLAFFGVVLLTQPPLLELIDTLNILVPICFVGVFIFNGFHLRRIYRSTTLAHVRRQVLLIAYACIIVASLWVVLRTIPMLLWGQTLLPPHILDLFSMLVPAAYLVGGLVPDLYRTERGARWLAAHMVTTAALGAALAGILDLAGLVGPQFGLWLAVSFIALYRPAQQLWAWVRRRGGGRLPYQPLIATAAHLPSTLDASRLAEMLCDGVQAAYGQAPVGFFLGDLAGTSALTCVVQRGLSLPAEISPGALTAALQQSPPVSESRALTERIGAAQDEDAAALLSHATIALWCPLVEGTKGHLLGLLVLGLRGDLDPYRGEDLIELRRLMDAAVLAFTNSAAYREVAESAETIRQLYRRLNTIQSETSAAIAREIHDEIINMTIRLNLNALRHLLGSATEAQRGELADLIFSHSELAAQLRLVCEYLSPNGLDEPCGLPGVLQRQIERSQSGWGGQVTLEVTGAAIPIARPVQLEALRITREAIVNAIKHARGADRISVVLEITESQLRLTIADNGQGGAAVQPVPGHWGLRDMREGAGRVGGSLAIERRSPGVAIIFTCAPEGVGESYDSTL